MKLKIVIATTLALGTAISFAGCSSAPAPKPTPTVMSKTEAADLYLKTVCPSNFASDDLFNAFNADPVDLEAIKSAAAAFAATEENAAQTFDDSSILWPKNVKSDMPAMAEDAFSTLSWISQIQGANTIEETYVAVPDLTKSSTASQRIRSRLGLSSDTKASCEAYK